ncbi:MAG: hypothetical protein ABSF81_07740 [Bacteroidales bacterium]|jgi:hypothetical protein
MEIKDQILAWLDGPRDYQEGLNLFLRVSKKHRLMEKLMTWRVRDHSSKLYFKYHEKLVYELSLFIDPLSIPVLNEDEPGGDNNESPKDLNSTQVISNGISRAGWNENNKQSFIRRQLTDF